MRLLGAVVFLVIASAAAAESKRPLPGVRLPSPPVIDGIVDEQGEWATAAKSQGFTDTVTERPAADDTLIWMGYDDKAIYIAFRCLDSDPSKIVARSIQPGSDMEGEDTFMFMIDPLRRLSWDGGRSRFIVNSLGTTREDIAGGRSTKREWRGEWKAAARRTDSGWEGEMMIPWRMLDTPGGKKDMQINFRRDIQRTKSGSMWSSLTQNWRIENEGIWQGVESPKTPVTVQYQVYATPEYNKDADPKTTFRTGVDVRAKLTPSLFGLGSLNPDFRNIEQQIAGIEFTRSERFLNDARPFFTEGSGFFSLGDRFSFGRMFYTRRIDDFDQGLKFYGSVNRKLDAGLLVAREDGNRTDIVANVSQRFGLRSSMNLYATGRLQPGDDSTAAGGAYYTSNGKWGFGVDGATTRKSGKAQGAGSVAVDYQVPKIFVIARAMTVAKGFGSDLALIPFTDRHGGYLFAEYNADLRTGPLVYQGASVDASYFERGDGSNHDRSVSFNMRGLTRSDIFFNFGASTDLFFDESSTSVFGGLTFNQNNRQKSFNIFGSTGVRDGRRESSINAGISRRLFKGFDASLSHSIFRFDGQTTQTILGASWEIDKHQSIAARWVQQDKESGWYVSYRKAGNSGLEWYAIVGDPNSTTFKQRFALKVIWAS